MPAPRLSVVIAAHNASAVIAACLSALDPQCRDGDVEVIVADSSTDDTPRTIAGGFPWVRLLHVDGSLPLPALRGRGIAMARGEVIAVLDPYSVAAPDWSVSVLRAHEQQAHPVIGGAVDLYRAEDASWATWAVYLNEYGLFMPPVVRGPAWIVPGSNLSYKRAALYDGATPRYPVFWKTFVNWEIEGSGASLWLEPDVRVALNKPIAFGDFLRTRYHHGRCFAAMRVDGASWPVRLFRAAVTPLVPFLQLWRWTSGFWRKGSYRARFVATLPAQLAFFTSWAWGEARGSLGGSGRSCEQLYY